MKIIPAAERPTRAAEPAYFVGQVWQDPILTTPTEAPQAALRVSFAPGGRTNWHTHPGGQCLHVLSGLGLVQKRGEPARPIRAGDTVWIEPGEEHWHGASAAHGMVHLAMQAVVDGRAADWLEPVSEADYAAAQPG